MNHRHHMMAQSYIQQSGQSSNGGGGGGGANGQNVSDIEENDEDEDEEESGDEDDEDQEEHSSGKQKFIFETLGDLWRPSVVCFKSPSVAFTGLEF